MAQPAQAFDHLLRWADWARLAVRAADVHIHFDVSAGRAVLGSYLGPVLPGDGQQRAPHLPGQPVLLGLLHHRLRLGHSKIPHPLVTLGED